MQLFILDRHPEKSAQMLADIHLRKMCLETAQILSAVTVMQKNALPEMLPKVYNLHHPVILAVNTPFKINWVLALNRALHQEYFFRFHKCHAYAENCRIYHTLLFSGHPAAEDWSFARMFKNFTTTEPDIVQAYREYYRFKKTLIDNWHYTERTEPLWLK